MRIIVLAILWIIVCSYGGWRWWRIRKRAVAVRLYLEAEAEPNPESLRLARFRVVVSTSWSVTGWLGALLGVLAILDRGGPVQTALIFAGPVILAIMGYQQDRHEQALMVAAAEQIQVDEA